MFVYDTPYTFEQGEYMKKIEFINSLQEVDEDTVFRYIDFEQSSDKEKEALDDFIHYTMDMKHTNEWVVSWTLCEQSLWHKDSP